MNLFVFSEPLIDVWISIAQLYSILQECLLLPDLV